MKKSCIIVSVTLVLVFLLCLVGCGKSKEEQADELLEEGKYSEAADIYKTLDSTDDIAKKLSQCQYFMFIDYLRDQGTIEIVNRDNQNKYKLNIDARDNGEIRFIYNTDIDKTSNANSGFNYKINMKINYNENEAPISAEALLNVLGAYTDETAEGYIDLETYELGQKIMWEKSGTDNKRVDGTYTKTDTNLLDDCGKRVKDIIKQLEKVLEESGTGTTLKDIGFKNL